MNIQKNKEIYFIIFLFLLSINPLLINSKNLCPFQDLQDLLIYYTKGINPSKESSDYKWEYIHCVNNYNNSVYLIRNDKDQYFNENAGIFIGSSINIAKLNESLINSFSISGDNKKILIKLIGKYGKIAEQFYKNTSFSFTQDEIKNINEQVYKTYSEEMKNYFDLKKDYGYSFYLTLLTFFVKYYKMDKYLEEVKDFLQKDNLFLISYYFLNLKSDNYLQNKLWSMVTLSSDKKYFTNDVRHIGIYYDTKLNNDKEKEFHKFIINLIKEFNFEHYYYSLGNFSGIIQPLLNRTKFLDLITNYSFISQKLDNEDINEGIMHFKEVFNNPLPEQNNYYQKHLIIFVNDVNNLKETINKDYFIKNGIQVILFQKVNKKSEEDNIITKFGDKFNIITFTNYSELVINNDYLKLLRSIINFNIQNYFFNNDNDIISISNIKTYGINNMQNFKITFNKNLLNNNDINYFHISLVYNNAKEIQTNNKNNANLTFFLSSKNPFSDIINNDIVNFCLNDTVHSNPNKSPFINYILSNEIKNYFYISITNANNINYNLTITLEKSYEENINISNGVFKQGNLDHNSKEFVATFSNNCIQRNCQVDYFSLLKYYSSGVHFTKSNDEFNKLIDKHLFGCLYKNVFCPFFDIENKQQQTVIKYENGYLLGLGLNLSNITSSQLLNDSIPLYIINKLRPFLSDSLNISIIDKTISKALNDCNLYLTSEEIDTLNMNYLSNIYKYLQKKHKKFLNLKHNLKMALFLRVLEEGSTFEQIESYLKLFEFKNFDEYIKKLKEPKLSRLTTQNSTDFQMMLIQTRNIIKPKKCLVSLVIGKSLIWSDEFYDLLGKINNYRISVTYYDSDNNKTHLLEDFNEDVDVIKKRIIDLRNKSSQERTEIVDIDQVLKQQKSLFKYFDEGIKKCIVIISTKENDIYYKYGFTKPNKDLLQDLHNSGIIIFDYSDHINFFLNEAEEDVDNLDFFNSSKIDFIQYVPFLNFSDMNNNTVTLSNMINRYPIPLNKIDNIYLDLEREEVITYEFFLQEEVNKLKNKNYFDQYNILKLTFSVTGLNIYFSDKFIFPNKYSSDFKYEINEENKNISYDLKKLNDYKFFMSIQTANRIDNSIIEIDLCDSNNNCLKKKFYMIFYISFIVGAFALLIYALYIFFKENRFKEEGNIFKKKY